jgi:hypothetical protein
MNRPTSRRPVGRSSGERRTASVATISGMDAMRIAVSELDTYCSPIEISVNGTAISHAA